ncbi:hypothetical protein SEA_LILBEANIE_93 [Gordonia phage Lilbeanie]|uniref:Uncharacterized protein n=1 Tax=Gordonia phage Lilbeanie TaxID=2794947 RepID=A0A7T1KSC9_9CAUD|nr:hypothetical protein J1773_gp93 [Gordonia phage Lilbeanie]QPO17171.1 hypothetical protein SEA_LILBEANIE_93 [Gordonia phage Lilbeanie]
MTEVKVTTTRQYAILTPLGEYVTRDSPEAARSGAELTTSNPDKAWVTAHRYQEFARRMGATRASYPIVEREVQILVPPFTIAKTPEETR